MSEAKATPAASAAPAKTPAVSETAKPAAGTSKTIQNGKGDAPRNISRKFRANYDGINWGKPKKSRAKATAGRR